MSVCYKEIYLKSRTKEALETEVRYEIAGARVDKIELMRLNFKLDESEENFGDNRKLFSFLIRSLKKMKIDGKIQFFAIEDNFSSQSTEAIFLINKYPTYFSEMLSKDGEMYIYVKI